MRGEARGHGVKGRSEERQHLQDLVHRHLQELEQHRHRLLQGLVRLHGLCCGVCVFGRVWSAE